MAERAATIAGGAPGRSRLPALPALALLATIVVALATAGCGRSAPDVRCPPGATCASWAPFTAEELVHAPEVCRGEIAQALARDGVVDGGTVAIPVEPWSSEPARRRVTASSLARALTGLEHALGDRAQRVVAVIDAARLADGCASQDVADLALALGRATTSDGGDPAARGDAPAPAAVELFCRPRPDARAHRHRSALLWRVAVPGAGGSRCRALRADHTCADGALVDLAVSGMAAGGNAARTAGGDVAGFVTAATRGHETLHNQDFALGFAGWETSGEVALRTRDDARPDRCAPLLARLAPGASVRQAPRSLPGAGGRASRAARSRERAHDLALAIDVEPAASARSLTVASGDTSTVLPIAAGESALRARLPRSGDHEPLTVGVAPTATEPVALRSVRIAEPEEDERAPRRARHERALRWLAANAPSRGDGTEAQRDEPLHLDGMLEDARALLADEDFVRVERFGSDDPSLRSGILAHPGTDTPTRIEFDLPAFACSRHLTTRVALVPDCRASSDGVLFRVRSGDAAASVLVGGPDHAATARLELQLDDPHDARAPLAERTLILETESGPAHDTRCDWAVWVEPTVTCGDEHGVVSRDGHDAAAAPPARTIEVPAGDGSVIITAWDEINVWKLYAFFGPMGAKARRAAQEPDWLVRRLPWLTHVRVLAALGGNTCRHIRPACERSERTPDHPFDPPCWEGRDGRAAAYELLHDDDPPRLDASVWGAALDELLRGGVKPHLNLSAAPCLLTGGEHHYRDYHWNQIPVADRDGYDALLRAFAGEARRRGAGPQWRLSIVNEPNCLWIAPPPGSAADAAPEVAHIGFLGDAATYAAQFASTARLLRELLPGIRLHIGNFTIGGKYPLEDNLAEYLGVLAPQLARKGVPASELSAISFSIYESPQHGLDDLPAYKLGIVDRARGPGSPFRDLPIKLDEVEIHPLVAERFQADTGGDVDTTRWAAAWHADMAAMALDTGVRSLAPWLGRLIPDDELERPLPKYWTYALLSLATGQAIAPDGPLGDARALHAPTEQQRAAAPRLVALHRAADDRDGLGWLVTRDAASGVTWIALWRHAHTPLTDAAADSLPPLEVTLTGPGGAPLAPAGTVVEALGIGPVSPPDARPWTLSPFRTTAVRAWQTPLAGGAPRLALGQESIVLLRIPPEHAGAVTPPSPGAPADDRSGDATSPSPDAPPPAAPPHETLPPAAPPHDTTPPEAPPHDGTHERPGALRAEAT